MTPDQNNGWVKLHRTITEWGWYKDGNTARLFIHLLLTANHRDKQWMGVTVKRGQVVVGTRKLAQDTGIPRQSVRTSLDRLKSTHEITIEPTRHYSIVTICNYDDYQSDSEASNPPSNPPASPQVTHGQPTGNPQVTPTKNVRSIERVDTRAREEGSSNPDAAIPTLWEVAKLGATVGATPEQCESFYAHYQGNNLWLNRHGRMIDVRMKLRAWVVNDQARVTKEKLTHANGSNRGNFTPEKRITRNVGGNAETDGSEYAHLVR